VKRAKGHIFSKKRDLGNRHSFTNPDADKAGMDALGHSASADARSWAHMNVFFEEVFSK